MGETYYEVLGVDPDATVDEIESAYRDRVLETHPDHSDDPDAAEQFDRVTTAKSVLTDETKRARYDRLGHDAYVDVAQEPADGSTSSDGAAGTARSTSSARRERTTTATGTDRTRTTAGNRQAGNRTGRRQAGTERDHRTGSHHARHRSQRHRKRARQQAAGDWPFEGTGPESGRGERTQAGGSTGEQQAEEFQYTVHDWDGDVDLEWEGPPLRRRTIVSVGLLTLLYPLLVTASLTPLFSLSVNAVVAACTLSIAGYLLTMPRLAMAAFGIWSVCFPIGLMAIPWLTPVSVIGLFTIGFAWVPFGYATALWWVLRP